MATTLVGSATVGNVPSATGHSNASTLIYGVNSARWFFFVLTAGDTTHVNVYVSSSNDLSSATWATIGTGTQSPVFNLSAVHTANDGRNFAIGYVNVGSTDVCYVLVGMTSTNVEDTQATRVTLTASVATWGTWVNQGGSGAVANTPDGSAVGVSSTVRAWLLDSRFTSDRDTAGIIATNVDAGSSWTAGWGAVSTLDNSQANTINSGALMPLASGFMLGLVDSGAVTATTTQHMFRKSSSATAWPANSAWSAIFAGTITAADKNDWAAVGVSTADVHVVRKKTSTAFEHRRTADGVTWGTLVNITSTGITGHLAGSGIGLATDGTDVWLFVIDTDANKNVKYLHWTVGAGWDAAWSTLTTSDTNVKNFISVAKSAGNSQVGVMWTENTSTPFAVVGSFLSTASGVTALPPGLGPVVGMPEWAHFDTAMTR